MDGAAFRAILARQGAELVLHGHTHRTTMQRLETPAGAAAVIGVPSASAMGGASGRGARYHLYYIRRDHRGWNIRIAVRAYSPEGEHFGAGEDDRTLSTLP